MAQAAKEKILRRKTREELIKMRAAGAWDVFSDATKNFSANGDGNQAAAIALYAILSAIPLFILTILAAESLLGSMTHIQTDIVNAIRNFHPYFSENILKQLGQIEGKRKLLGWVGVLGLVWLSAAIFNAIESALNMIFRSQVKRNYLISKLMALSMIPAAWVIGGLSVLISYVAALFAKEPLVLPGDIEISLTLPAQIILRYLIPYVMVMILITAVYRIIPTDKIRFRVALTGGVVFAFLLEAAKQFFTGYVANYARYHVIFGSLEAVVILVIWVFYVALIFLFCAEMMSSYERRDRLLLERALLKPRQSRLKVDERLFRKFGRAYAEGSVIFHENDPGREMFYILSGRIALERVDCSVKKTLAQMGPGQYFGEMAALIDVRRTATARALTDSHLAVIDDVTFRDLIRESRESALYMLREFSMRLKNTNAALEEFTGLWTRLLILMHIMSTPGVPVEKQIPVLSRITGKEPAEISNVFQELTDQNILLPRDRRRLEIDFDRMWAMLDSGALKQCRLDEGIYATADTEEEQQP